jgi:predicted small secreted protein
MKTKAIAILILFAFLLSSCATLFKGASEKVNFGSDPTGAKVYINGQYMGTTPFELKLQSKQTYNIEFRKDGFQNKTVLITNNVGAGWIILDILAGLIPIIVDAATGNWMQLDQTNVNAALEAQQ